MRACDSCKEDVLRKRYMWVESVLPRVFFIPLRRMHAHDCRSRTICCEGLEHQKS